MPNCRSAQSLCILFLIFLCERSEVIHRHETVIRDKKCMCPRARPVPFGVSVGDGGGIESAIVSVAGFLHGTPRGGKEIVSDWDEYSSVSCDWDEYPSVSCLPVLLVSSCTAGMSAGPATEGVVMLLVRLFTILLTILASVVACLGGFKLIRIHIFHQFGRGRSFISPHVSIISRHVSIISHHVS